MAEKEQTFDITELLFGQPVRCISDCGNEKLCQREEKYHLTSLLHEHKWNCCKDVYKRFKYLSRIKMFQADMLLTLHLVFCCLVLKALQFRHTSC